MADSNRVTRNRTKERDRRKEKVKRWIGEERTGIKERKRRGRGEEGEEKEEEERQ